MKWYEYFLFPFSLLYGSVAAIRNFFFDRSLFKVYTIKKKSIVVGNLSVGGTGKSPHIMYLANLLKDQHKVATLSRGYGRKTKGFYEVKEQSIAEEVGDEPLMFKKRLGKEVLVTVDEKRARTSAWLDEKETIDCILLDDAFQHRAVKAGMNILLTDFNRPFFKDQVLPAGRLREFRGGKKRAEIILVTKCPNRVSAEIKKEYIRSIGFSSNKVFFSQIVYGELVPFGAEKDEVKQVFLITGIANPEPLENHLKRFYAVETAVFPDHYNFTRIDLERIHAKFDKFEGQKTMLVTTEKDFVRIENLLTVEEKIKYPWHYQSIEVRIDHEKEFNELIHNYVSAIPRIS